MTLSLNFWVNQLQRATPCAFPRQSTDTLCVLPRPRGASSRESPRRPEMLHRSLGETISVETVRGAGLWNIEADPNELEAAILNLAVNARDSMPDGGRLTIETGNTHIDEAYAARNAEVLPGQYVGISVSDTAREWMLRR